MTKVLDKSPAVHNDPHMPPPPAKLLTTAEVAEILGKSVPTVTRMVADGKLDYWVKLPGVRGAYLFDLATVEAAKDDAA